MIFPGGSRLEDELPQTNSGPPGRRTSSLGSGNIPDITPPSQLFPLYLSLSLFSLSSLSSSLFPTLILSIYYHYYRIFSFSRHPPRPNPTSFPERFAPAIPVTATRKTSTFAPSGPALLVLRVTTERALKGLFGTRGIEALQERNSIFSRQKRRRKREREHHNCLPNNLDTASF